MNRRRRARPERASGGRCADQGQPRQVRGASARSWSARSSAPTCSARASTRRWRRSSASRSTSACASASRSRSAPLPRRCTTCSSRSRSCSSSATTCRSTSSRRILTITGYSVNDTIVIFDRVRENLRSKRRDSLEKVVNESVNQTLSRTVITAGTTFLAVLVALPVRRRGARRLRVHDAGRHHQRHLFDDFHRGGDRDHPWQPAGQGPSAAGTRKAS